MHEFAIHLLVSSDSGRDTGSLIWIDPRPSVMAALSLARSCAPSGSVVEVWRDYDCVHRETLQ
jgi:hypothetical protein